MLQMFLFVPSSAPSIGVFLSEARSFVLQPLASAGETSLWRAKEPINCDFAALDRFVVVPWVG